MIRQNDRNARLSYFETQKRKTVGTLLFYCVSRKFLSWNLNVTVGPASTHSKQYLCGQFFVSCSGQLSTRLIANVDLEPQRPTTAPADDKFHDVNNHHVTATSL